MMTKKSEQPVADPYIPTEVYDEFPENRGNNKQHPLDDRINLKDGEKRMKKYPVTEPVYSFEDHQPPF